MLPGPVIVNVCPHCKGLLRQRTLASGNTFGAKYWTDGQFKAPMLPASPSLIRCRHCLQVAWCNEFNEVDSYESYLGFLAFSEDEIAKQKLVESNLKRNQYEGLPYFEEPGADHIVDFVSHTNLSSDQELLARTCAWRIWNDDRRDEDTFKPLLQPEKENLLRIVELLEAEKDHKLLLAESYRELGNFDASKRILEQSIFTTDEHLIVQLMLELIELGDTQVCLIKDDDVRKWRLLRRFKSRNELKLQLPEFAASGPPFFEICSRDWWFKPIDRLVHNWALIEKLSDKKTIVYFFYDLGLAKNRNSKYNIFQLNGRCAVIDSLVFEGEDSAVFELKLNGFQELSKSPGPWDECEPFGTLYDARDTEDQIYSKGDFWERL